MKQLGKKLMSWASILEDGTREQAERTAAMPFIFPHVALMPDAHLGRGGAVGSVIPTIRAIIPAAVGVDIGCFRRDTRIPLLNGTQKSLQDMAEAGGNYWVYSLDSGGHVVPGNAVALRTRTDAELMRIVVSGGDEIICTPDHPFMLNNGAYREVRDLRFNDRLMPLCRTWQTRDGYESVSTGTRDSRQTHVLVYEAINGPVPDGHVVHHKNHVHFDNDPGNLEALDAGEHSRYHRTAGQCFANASPDFQEHGHNHKVILVEHIEERADVYCLKVEDHHNFALAAGVFVHNCGMIALRTQLTARDAQARGDLSGLRTSIERAIPLSAGKNNTSFYDAETTQRIAALEERDGAGSADNISPNWRLQLGSLGSGNHFIEVSLDEEDRVWLFLHSGSRGVGNKLAQRHIKVAQGLAVQGRIQLPDPDLAYLDEGTDEFWAYIRDLRWAQHFALLNREEMMHRVVDCVRRWIGRDVEASETVNTHHNYTAQETHFGELVWLSRKGAIDASAGRPGLIPGSMGTRSYVVTGQGNRLALNSAPHGAGRRYSRSKARKTFTRGQLDAAMRGIEWRRTDKFLDEIPDAYKPVEVIMNDARDLVEIRHMLRQIVNVKGD